MDLSSFKDKNEIITKHTNGEKITQVCFEHNYRNTVYQYRST